MVKVINKDTRAKFIEVFQADAYSDSYLASNRILNTPQF